MLQFRNDYSEGAHPQVMEALLSTNLQKTPGYGTDLYCAAAADTIRSLCSAPAAQVHFLVGGTQTNKVALGAFLRPYEAVIAPETAHIATHETGAIEQDGHKILTVPAPEGKLTPEGIQPLLDAHTSEHMVLPRLIYLSNTTEFGTVYSKGELAAISRFCRKKGLLLYCDGARLGSAMTVEGADTTFADYAALCDAFTIGGTKNGLLFGEALVVTTPALQPHFRYAMKQQGAILAKGRLLGVQFQAILQGDLYCSLARQANAMAQRLRLGLQAMGVPLAFPSPSNQVFPVVTRETARALAEVCAFEVQHPVDSHRLCIRLVTAWTTTAEEVDALLEALRGCLA